MEFSDLNGFDCNARLGRGKQIQAWCSRSNAFQKEGTVVKRRTEIIIEIEREIVISQSRNTRSWCMRCGKPVQMLDVTNAALMLRTTSSGIHRLAESEELHFADSLKGELLICTNSVLALRQNENSRPFQNLLVIEGER